MPLYRVYNSDSFSQTCYIYSIVSLNLSGLSWKKSLIPTDKILAFFVHMIPKENS